MDDRREGIVTSMRQPLMLFGSEIESTIGDEGVGQEAHGGGVGTLVLSLASGDTEEQARARDESPQAMDSDPFNLDPFIFGMGSEHGYRSGGRVSRRNKTRQSKTERFIPPLRKLIRYVSNDEIKDALFQMHPTKAPGRDGMSPNVCDEVRHLPSSGHMLTKINYTHVTLIPKKLDPTTITQLRPTSLCNVIYKICSKVLTNQLKLVLPEIISPSQSAFIPGRLISNNCLVASEIEHYMHRKNNGWNRMMALKLDISKAYDRIEWSFFDQIMKRLGFAEEWIHWIMMCVSTMSYSFKLNREHVGLVYPKRRICQDLILSIPLSLFYPTVSMIWAKEPKGFFTTKSVYFVARLCQGMDGDEPTRSVVNVDTKFLWKALWQAKVPGKVKICVWHGYMNVLPSKVNLKNRAYLRRILVISVTKKRRQTAHALLLCPRVAAVWFGSLLGLCSFHRNEERFRGWLDFELILFPVWNVWKVRNDFIWISVDVSPLDTQIKAQMWLVEFKKWNDAAPRIYKWHSLVSGWIKCNFDATWDEKGSIGGFGMVVRNSDESFVAAQVSREEVVQSALQAEAAAARAATLFLSRWVTEQVEVECIVVIMGICLVDTRHLLQDFKQWKITFGRRETNKVAHRLARFSLTIDHPISWFEEPPDVISNLLLEDSTSS
ncbi:hypothetical protein D8674_028621 [Pyrus ussuriensis x Pyrus communis]|uniref:Reverse transcriptase domain-containing protein n=1 Tax=Pyrus ussuriensis x Pyrus communis TaxID=2448454 RepID=A0A5N5IA83_9ROSA|nr:hypothetical protein D8674_028621 [Pyrus ussuriensis x Pyrus communis]